MHTNTERSVLLASVERSKIQICQIWFNQGNMHAAFWEDLTDAYEFPFHQCCVVLFCASPSEDRNDKDDHSNRKAISKQ